MKIFLLIVFVFWLAKIAKDILFWTYLWQLKEYRLDRMRAHFELRSARGLFLNRLYLLRAVLLGVAFLLTGIWGFFFLIIAGGIYLVLGLRSVYAAYTKQLKDPVYTKKAIGIFVIAIAAVTVLSVFVFINLPSNVFLASLIALDILIPILLAGIVAIFKFPSELFKKLTIHKAKKRREGLNNLLVIGITGSYGKTSLKEFLGHILSDKLRVVKTEKNHNTEIGVAQTVIEELTQESDIFVVEMGAYRTGEIRKICDIVKPQIGILSGLDEQHISLFGSMAKTQSAKYELIESLPKKGLAIFNGENDYSRNLYERTSIPKRLYALRSFSVSAPPDATCEKIDFNKDGMQFYIKLDGKKELFETALVGKHNALNIAGASLAAYYLGMNLEEIKERVKTISAPAHTLELKQGINSCTLIDDSYSANPHGVLAALEVLNSIKGNKKILILYPLIELGRFSRDIHRKFALRINKICDLCILTSPDFARDIKNNAPNTDVVVMQNPRNVVEKLAKFLGEDDVVLLENRIPADIVSGLSEPKKVELPK